MEITERLNQNSITGMNAEQIWSAIVDHVNRDGGSKFKNYNAIAEHLALLATKSGMHRLPVLRNLSLAAKAAGSEARWAILGDRAELVKANEAKWKHLRQAGAINV